jgi:hypothetical protein
MVHRVADVFSFRQSIKQLDETEALNRAAAKAFADAVETSAEHVVEVNREDAANFRQQVLTLAERVGSTAAAEDLDQARTQYRGELRDYSRKASETVSRMREDLDAAAKAMQRFAAGVSTSGAEHESVMRREFTQLRSAAESDDVREVRYAVHQTLDAVTASYESLQAAHNLVIAEMKDEIRVLQGELERSRTNKRVERNPADDFGARARFDKQIEDLLQRGKAFDVLVLSLPERPAGEAANLAALFAKQAEPAIPVAWRPGIHVVIASGPVAVAEWRAVLASAATPLPCLELVRCPAGENATRFFAKLTEAVRIAARM